MYMYLNYFKFIYFIIWFDHVIFHFQCNIIILFFVIATVWCEVLETALLLLLLEKYRGYVYMNNIHAN